MLGASIFFYNKLVEKTTESGAPPYGVSEESIPNLGLFSFLDNWERPDVPVKVALQVGHYLNDELPDELEKLRNSDGTRGGGKNEWEVNAAIAKETAELLEEKGIEVDILPATIPPGYWADVFVAIHADGNEDSRKRGFKVASPWRDFSGDSKSLVTYIEESYEEETGFSKDINITRNMRGYYAFSWWRYEHSIHPMTTAAILETGFLTNPSDRKILINSPKIAARGIANGVIKYLSLEGLITSPPP